MTESELIEYLREHIRYELLMMRYAQKTMKLDRALCHPHALRHAAGHALANSGRVNAYQLQAIMGHKDARSTHIYVQGVAGLIDGLWD
jgi:integrase